MNKKIWITGALCIAAIFITVFIYNNFVMDKEAAGPPAEAEKAAAAVDEYLPETAGYSSLDSGGKELVRFSNDIFTTVFSSDGGVPVSIKLNNYYTAEGENVDMIFSGKSGQYPFSLHDGGFDSAVITGKYSGSQNGDEVVFKTSFTDSDGSIFDVTKSYRFFPGSYMLRFNLEISPVEGKLPLGDGTYVYSLEMGPQLGPEIDSLTRLYVYRYFCLIDEGEKRNIGTPEEERKLSLDTAYRWLGVEGRYFAGITVPGFKEYSPAWDERETGGIFKRNSYFIQRKSDSSAQDGRISDSYYVYYGPKDRNILDTFDRKESNSPGLEGLDLGIVADQNRIIAVLSSAVKVRSLISFTG